MKAVAGEEGYRKGSLAKQDKLIGLQEKELGSRDAQWKAGHELDLKRLEDQRGQWHASMTQRANESDRDYKLRMDELNLRRGEAGDRKALTAAQVRHLNAQSTPAEVQGSMMQDAYHMKLATDVARKYPSDPMVGMVAAQLPPSSFNSNAEWEKAVLETAAIARKAAPQNPQVAPRVPGADMSTVQAWMRIFNTLPNTPGMPSNVLDSWMATDKNTPKQ